MTIDPAKLNEIREACEGACKGPWHVLGGSVQSPDQFGYVAELSSPRGGLQRDRDARFIALSREAVPALLAEVERLTLKCEAFNNIAASWGSQGEGQMLRAEAAEAKLAALQARGDALAKAAADLCQQVRRPNSEWRNIQMGEEAVEKALSQWASEQEDGG